MLPPLFYAPPQNRTGDIIELSAAEGRHAQSVLRLSKGTPVIVVDGIGTAFRGELTGGPRSKKVTVGIHSETRHYGEPSIHLTLAVGLSVGSKFDEIIDKGTQLGVRRFVPLVTNKTKMRFDDPKRLASRLKRWEKVALAALKQCRRSYLPNISTPTSVVDFLPQVEPGSLSLIFHPDPSVSSFDNLSINSDYQRAYLLVGPESGFSDDEYQFAIRAGFTPTRLGTRILRTETAGPAVCALVMNAVGELR
ncbi:MAG: 16S rRNA (uracil(1498)-N(3))-methyltransferase [candidate division Zixibacteria bacterium]|nr:16S rRNA (uracil(1498)-N(3))-methyltransferase [candidate division Zixibacteria bacterium]